MKSWNKKGQTEDILADLIPALIIMAIAVYSLSSFSSTHEDKTEMRKLEVESQLASKANINTYLQLPISLSSEGSSLTTADLIVKLEEDKASPIYLPKLKTQTNEFKNLLIEYYGSISELKCPYIEIEYPDGTIIKPSQCGVLGNLKDTIIPLKDGKHAIIRFAAGIGPFPPTT